MTIKAKKKAAASKNVLNFQCCKEDYVGVDTFWYLEGHGWSLGWILGVKWGQGHLWADTSPEN